MPTDSEDVLSIVDRVMFNSLTNFLIISGVIKREELIDYLHTEIELDATERKSNPQIIAALRSRLDILRRETLDEEFGPDHRENQRKLLARIQADQQAQKAKRAAARAKRKSGAAPQPSDAAGSPRGDAAPPDATSPE